MRMMRASMCSVVEVLTSRGKYELQVGSPVIVPAEDLMIAISRAGDVYHDGRRRRTRNIGGVQVLSTDLSRSTGFHHLRVGLEQYWFGTEDAKLRLRGIMAMLDELRERGLGWSGQLAFSDGTRLRDARVLYGFLDQYADRALNVASAIVRHPRLGTSASARVTSRAGGRVLRRQTIALVRARGRDIVDADPNGIFSVGAERFSPRKVITSRRAPTLDTAAHRSVTWLLQALRALCVEVVAEAAGNERERCAQWAAEAQRTLEHVARLRAVPPPPAPLAEEIADTRYADALRIARILYRATRWSPQDVVQPSYAYVRYADEIFQIYVAQVLSRALGLAAVDRRAHGPAYASEEWELFAGTLPHEHVLRSWLSYTETPRDLLPDIVLFHKPDGTVVVGDAKYRNEGTRVSSSSVKEVLAYMGAFNLPRAIIFFPPSPPAAVGARVEGAKGRELVEIGIAPVPELDLDVIRAAIDSARFTPSWRD